VCGNGALPFVGREAIYVPARDSTEIAIRSLYSDGEFFFFPARNFTEPKLTLLVPGAGRVRQYVLYVLPDGFSKDVPLKAAFYPLRHLYHETR